MAFFHPVFLTMFFFVSGYLFKSDYSFGRLLEHKIRTLLIPFLIFVLLLLASAQVLTFNEHSSFSRDLLDSLLQIRGKNDQIWFVAALFVMNFPFYVLVKYAKSTRALLLIAFVGFLLSVMYDSWLKLPALPWHIQFIGNGCFYMALGFAYRKHEQKLKSCEKRTAFFSVLSLYFAFVAIRKFILHLPDISFDGSFYFIDALIITLLGIFAMIYISKRLTNAKLILFVGANSLLYFCMHGKVYSLLQVITEKIFSKFAIAHSETIDFLLGLGMTFLVAIILIIPVILINRYLHFLIGKGYKLWNSGN
jgi:fucose 4-O-acetylase-like acetyltransferase